MIWYADNMSLEVGSVILLRSILQCLFGGACHTSFICHSPLVPNVAPSSQTIWNTFSLCLRIWPILCNQFMTIAKVLVRSGESDILCC